MRRSLVVLVAPWVPPPRADTKVTMPPPPGGEVGGSFGVSQGYSDRLARTPYWKRMALSTFALRMKENETRYPMSATRPGEYDIRYTMMPYPDHHKHRPLLEIGEPRRIPAMHIPVILLVNLFDDAKGDWLGKKFETVYVPQHIARESLLPQRFAIYATEKAYQLLGLPVKHHAIHREIPKTPEQYKKILAQQHYNEERWQYDIEFLFREYADGPPEMRVPDAEGPEAEEEAGRWAIGGEEEAVWMAQVAGGHTGAGGSTGAGGAGGVSSSSSRGPRKVRKARKVKLF